MKVLWIFLAIGIAYSQTTRYPAALDSDSSLFVVSDNIQSTLSVAMQPADTALVVQSGTGFLPNMIASICDNSTSTGKCTSLEHMLVMAVNGNVLTVTRGFAGTTAIPHTAGKLVSALIDAAHQKVLKDATVAIETGLGPNLSQVLGTNPALARTVMNTYWVPPPVLYNIIGNVNPSGSGSPSVPTVGFGSWMRQNQTGNNDAVAVMPSCEVNVPNATCFGLNVVLGTNGNASGATNPTLIGLEIDLAGYYAPSSNSNALTAVMYNVQNPASALLVRNGNHGVTPPAWGKAYDSEDGAAATALNVGQLGFGVNQISQNILFHSSDATVGHQGEIVQVPSGQLALNFTGIYANSQAVKMVIPVSCTTAATAGSTCNTTVTWPGAFADDNYSTFCTIQATSGVPYVLNEQSGRTPAAAIIQIGSLTAAAAAGNLNCIGIHY